MQAQISVINFHHYTANKKTLLDRYRSTFDKGTQSINVTPPIKFTPFFGTLETSEHKKTKWICRNIQFSF